jgi:hypothetical protein
VDRVARAALEVLTFGEQLICDDETPQRAVARIAGVHIGYVRPALKAIGFSNIYSSAEPLLCTRAIREQLEARVDALGIMKSVLVPTRDPTSWEHVDRMMAKAQAALRCARTAEEFQSIGLLCTAV